MLSRIMFLGVLIMLCFGEVTYGHNTLIQDVQVDHQLHALVSRMDAQERQLLDQGQEMSSLKRLLQDQREKLSQQDRLLQEQSERLTSQDRLLQEQSERLTSQDRLLQQKSDDISELKRLMQGPECLIQTQAKTQEQPRDDQSDQGEAVLEERAKVRRSDDGGPLEAVVSQLSQKVTQMDADLQTLKTNDNQQDHNIQGARASTFVRWGNPQCSNGSQLVYSGVVGGSFFTQTGAAANYLCLTMSPVFGDTKTTGAELYGGEYETNSDSSSQKDPSCAVCRATFATTLMVAGTNICSPGWHLQYSGYLMAGASSHAAATEFICVDTALQYLTHSDQDENGKLLYFTKTVCGSLPCSPYVGDKTVLCAVCSK